MPTLSERDLFEFIVSLASLNARALTAVVTTLIDEGAISNARGAILLRDMAGMAGDVPVSNPLIADLWGDSLSIAATQVEGIAGPQG